MKKLKELRIEKGLSQQQLAEQFGVSQQTVWKYETGVNEPDIKMLNQYADYFGVSIDYLVERTDCPLPPAAAVKCPITTDEGILLQWYRTKSSDIKKNLIVLIKSLKKNSPA
jgi:transcriptional regulator with XRE-family HTH domain